MSNQRETLLSKEDFIDWKASGITHQFMQAILDRLQALKDELAGKAGLDALQDRYICGMIRAFGEVLSVEVNDVIDDKESNENA